MHWIDSYASTISNIIRTNSRESIGLKKEFIYWRRHFARDNRHIFSLFESIQLTILTSDSENLRLENKKLVFQG